MLFKAEGGFLWEQRMTEVNLEQGRMSRDLKVLEYLPTSRYA